MLALGISGSAAFAGQKVNIEKKGTYIYWLRYTDADGADRAGKPSRFKGNLVDVSTDGLENATEINLHVLDKRTGNLAIMRFDAAADASQAKPLDITAEDFVYVPKVRLKIVSEEGDPLESGLVTLTDGEGTTMERVLTPADVGVAVFGNVASGELDVEVAAEGLDKTLDSRFELALDRKTTAFEKTIRVSGEVDTLAVLPSVPEKQSAVKPQPAQDEGSGILQGIVGLVLLAIIAAVVYVFVKSKGFTAESALRKLGVRIPDEERSGVPSPMSAAPEAPVLDDRVCPFCGQTKDATGMCACAIATGGGPGTAPGISGPTGARLVGAQGTYMGSIFQISGPLTIGRDPGNDIALPGDSTASRRHATVAPSNGDVVIRDEGSSNGTFVNGARITEQKLRPGDEVRIGGTRFRFEA